MWPLLAALALAAAPARSAEDDIEQAKALFNAGAQAYAATHYEDAVHSFEAAYKKAPRPAILFSLAQAYRRLHVVDQKPESLQAALANFRRYLQEVQEGGRRADATEAVGELEVLAARLPTIAAPPSTEAPVQSLPRTRLTVSTPTPGAQVSIDDDAPRPAPLMREVQPGQHRIKITADGYFDEEREIVAVEGDTVGLDRELRARPARLVIEGPGGAQVMVDGRFVGTTPLPPFEVAPGVRFLAITKNGYSPFSRELSLGRGQRETVQVRLSMTLQRVGAYGLFGVMALTGGISALFGLQALGHEANARDLQRQRETHGLSEGEGKEYATALQDRNDSSATTIVLLGTAMGIGLVGSAAYLFDTAVPPTPPPQRELTPTPDAGRRLDLSAAPLLSPGVAGATLSGRF
jgi:PEGA domain